MFIENSEVQWPSVEEHHRSPAEMLGTSLPGIQALALAVFEEGIRDYVYGVGLVRQEVEAWLETRGGRSPFAFDAVCETLGLVPEAVRPSVYKLRAQRPVTERRRRVRPNGRRHQHTL